jgi:antitoxin VapB
MNEELKNKIERIKKLLAEKQLDALLVQRASNFAWLTGGSASYVNIAEESGVASLLVTPRARHLITNNIEAPRLLEEEGVGEQGWDFEVSQWDLPSQAVDELTEGLSLGTDGRYPRGENLAPELVRLRANLTPVEQARFRELGRSCALAMNNAIYALRPGMTEFEIAARLAAETIEQGILPIVNLVATDDRIYSYRHPLPTEKQLEKYAMLVLCGRKHGLVASITRLVHFGALPGELQLKSRATAEIDAAFIADTRPGMSLADLFTRAQENYAQVGYPDEWKFHHQGGPAGYAPREAIASPREEWTVKEGQVFAWNPTITGTKSEDTILVKKDGTEILTEIPGWPMLQVEIDGQSISRPAILELR